MVSRVAKRYKRPLVFRHSKKEKLVQNKLAPTDNPHYMIKKTLK